MATQGLSSSSSSLPRGCRRKLTPAARHPPQWYLYLIIFMGFIFPTLVAGLGWRDWRGGFFFSGAARLVFVHHVRSSSLLPTVASDAHSASVFLQSTFCVNSLAHWLGETPFDDKHTPKDHFITALVTVGEGYHNFQSVRLISLALLPRLSSFCWPP